MTDEIKAYAAAGLAFIVAIIIGLFAVHERGVEHTKDVTSDSKALTVAQAKAQVETTANDVKAAKADTGADYAQQVVDAYRAAHPEPAMRVCDKGNSFPSVPPARTAVSGPQGTSPGPAALPEVPGRSPDIGPALDTILRASERLAVIDADRQHR